MVLVTLPVMKVPDQKGSKSLSKEKKKKAKWEVAL